MGIVKISEQLHDDLRIAGATMARSINAQAEYWIKIGMLAELHPELNYQQLLRMLLKDSSLSLKELVA